MEYKPLNDICRPKQWKTISTSNLQDEGYPVYGANGIIGFYSEYNHKNPTILITCRGATCGEIHICKSNSYVNGNAMALDDLSSDIYIRYLYYYLLSYDFNNIISGTAQPQITREGLKKLQVMYLPLQTQKKIVEVLDKAQGEYFVAAEHPAHLLVADLGQRRIHLQDQLPQGQEELK